MSGMKLDLKKFKKMSEDKKSTTLQHPDGHKIIVAHSALSPEMRKGLSELPCMPNSGKKEVKMADGGEVPDPSQEAAPSGTVININPSAPMPSNLMGTNAASPQAPGPSPSSSFNMASMPPSINPMAGLPDAPASSNEIPAMKEAAAPLASAPAPQAASSSEGLVPATAGNTGPKSPDPMQAYAQATLGGAALEEQGAREKFKAETALGAAQAADSAQAMKAAELRLAKHQEIVNEAEQERQLAINDIKAGHIDPNRYWNSLSTGKQIMSTIGLILGGFSASHNGENGAMKFLQSKIDADINAQKADLGAKEGLLANNLNHFKNLNDAEAMTRMQMNDYQAHLAEQTLANNKSPQALAAYHSFVGALQKQNAWLQSQMGSAGQDGKSPIRRTIDVMHMHDPARAKEMESRYIPSDGQNPEQLAAIPLPQPTRDALLAKQQLGAMAQDLYRWSEKHSGAINPTVAAQGRTKAAELQSLYRQAINGGVFKAGEQDFIDNIVDSDPTKFFNSIRVLPKLKEVIDSNSRQLNLLRRSVGLPPASARGAGSAGGYAPKSFKLGK